jgi:hypothetical protein
MPKTAAETTRIEGLPLSGYRQELAGEERFRAGISRYEPRR